MREAQGGHPVLLVLPEAHWGLASYELWWSLQDLNIGDQSNGKEVWAYRNHGQTLAYQVPTAVAPNYEPTVAQSDQRTQQGPGLPDSGLQITSYTSREASSAILPGQGD